MNLAHVKKVVPSSPVVAECSACGVLALLPVPLGHCFWCGGFIGREDIWVKDLETICDRLFGQRLSERMN